MNSFARWSKRPARSLAPSYRRRYGCGTSSNRRNSQRRRLWLGVKRSWSCMPCALLWMALLPAATVSAAEAVPSTIHLRDVTEATGIAFRSHRRQQRKALHRGNGRLGLGVVRLRRRRLIDIYFLNGAPLPGAERIQPILPQPSVPQQRRLDVHRRDGAAGVGDTGFGLGVAVADFNNNGLPRHLRQQFRPQRPVPQQRRRHVHRRDGRGRRGGRQQGGSGRLLLGHRGRRRTWICTAANYVRFTIRQPRRRGRRRLSRSTAAPRTTSRNPTFCSATTATARSPT
jgi:hypothetical protein